MDAHAVGLHHGRLAIAVDDQSRQVVAFAVYKPVGVVLRIVGYSDGDTHLQGRSQAALPKLPVNLHVTERKHAHGDGAYLVVAHGDETAVFCQHTHDVAFPDAFIHPQDGTREHPGMKAEQALFFSSF